MGIACKTTIDAGLGGRLVLENFAVDLRGSGKREIGVGMGALGSTVCTGGGCGAVDLGLTAWEFGVCRLDSVGEGMEMSRWDGARKGVADT